MKQYILVMILATLGACSNNQNELFEGSSIIDDGLKIHFLNNPKDLFPEEEYNIDIWHEKYRRKDLIVTVNNGSIKRIKADKGEEVYYKLNPKKSGTLKLVVYVQIEGKMEELGYRIIKIK